MKSIDFLLDITTKKHRQLRKRYICDAKKVKHIILLNHTVLISRHNGTTEHITQKFWSLFLAESTRCLTLQSSRWEECKKQMLHCVWVGGVICFCIKWVQEFYTPRMISTDWSLNQSCLIIMIGHVLNIATNLLSVKVPQWSTTSR